MDKEFHFEGKKYISAKRAAEIYGYNPDYIGQLCRENLIDAKRVGRVWFVSDEAMMNHKNGAAKKIAEQLPAGFVAVREVASQTGYSADYLTHLCRQGQLECRMVEDKWFVSQESVARHQRGAEEKQKARAEALKKEHSATRVVVPIVVPHTTTQKETISTTPTPVAFRLSEHASVLSETNTRSLNLPFTAQLAFVALVVILAVTPIIVSRHAQTVQVVISERGTATVVEAGRVVSSFFKKAYTQIALFLNNADSTPQTLTLGSSEGLVVVPASNDPQANEAATEYIKNSFSDETRVIPDDSGTSGVIQPIFRSGDDQQRYLYVMVPAKE